MQVRRQSRGTILIDTGEVEDHPEPGRELGETMWNCEVGEGFVQWRQGESASKPSLPPRLLNLALAIPIALLPVCWLVAERDLMDRSLVTLLLALSAVGFLWAGKALCVNSLRLQRVRMDEKGLQVAFTTVPGLLRHRTMSQRLVSWSQVRLVTFRKVPDQGVAFSAHLREPLMNSHEELELGPCVNFEMEWVAKAQLLLPPPIQQSAEFQNWGTEWQTAAGLAEWTGKPFQPQRGVPPRLRSLCASMLQGVVTFWAAYLVSDFEPYSWVGLLFFLLLVWGAIAWGVAGVALFGDSFQLHRLRISRHGLEFEFSRVPGLFGHRQPDSLQMTWKEVKQVEFHKVFAEAEGPSSHYAFIVELYSPFGGRHKKISVATDGHFERPWFDHVLTLLPIQTAKAAKFVDWNKDEPVRGTL
jgi:hypothetical protein